MREKNWESMYKTYLEYQAKKEASIGGYYGRVYTLEQFQSQYTMRENLVKQQIAEGKRKKMPNITRDIVNDDARSISRKQAQGFLKVARETTNPNAKLKDFYTYNKSREEILEQLDFDMLQQAYESGAYGFLDTKFGDWISATFFGSPI